MAHSAVLLAGGKSSRMGCDKALLPVGGEPLWCRQLRILQATAPEQIWISAPADAPYASPEAPLLPDTITDSGPLAGISAALAVCRSPWLLVLAVDLPAMAAHFLTELIAQAEATGRGVVPVNHRGDAEPLAAVYPKAAANLAAESLQAGRRKLSDLLDLIERQNGMIRRLIKPEESAWFANWNRPEDITGDGLGRLV